MFSIDEEYAKFPKLFHLDEYENCLKQVDGLYCVGTFHLKPLQEPDHIYELMEVNECTHTHACLVIRIGNYILVLVTPRLLLPSTRS